MKRNKKNKKRLKLESSSDILKLDGNDCFGIDSFRWWILYDTFVFITNGDRIRIV